jgi:hypothetical protein
MTMVEQPDTLPSVLPQKRGDRWIMGIRIDTLGHLKAYSERFHDPVVFWYHGAYYWRAEGGEPWSEKYETFEEALRGFMAGRTSFDEAIRVETEKIRGTPKGHPGLI